MHQFDKVSKREFPNHNRILYGIRISRANNWNI